jgi:hypothetical protein
VKKFLSALSIAILAMGACAPLAAQTHTVPVYSYPSAGTPPGVILQCDANADNCAPTSVANPLQTSATGSGGTTTLLAGSAIVGKVGIDQTTPGTTNGVQINAAIPVGANTIGNVNIQSAGTSLAAVADSTDGTTVSGTANALRVVTRNTMFNGTTWDRWRSIVGADGTGLGMGGVVISPVSSANAALVPVVSTTLESCHILKASAGNLYSLGVTIQATTVIIQVFNATTGPADGAVTPIWSMPVISNGTLGGDSWNFTVPLRGSVGLTVCASSATTPFTKTASATAMFSGQVQ